MNLFPQRFFAILLLLGMACALPCLASAQTLVATPAKLSFGNVVAGTNASLNQTLKNTGSSTIQILQVAESGSGFTLGSVTTPLELAPGHSLTYTVHFEPAKIASYSGSIVVLSSATDYRLSIAISGAGAAAGSISLSPTSISFGKVAVGSKATKTLTLTANGAAMTINSDAVSSSEYAISGLTLPLKLAAGKSVSFNATFTPQSAGAASGKLSLTASNPSSTVNASLSGTGTATSQPSVSLSWNADSSNVAGYNVYRATSSNGTYKKLTSSLETATDYLDTSVIAGDTYYYEVTAVNEKGVESGRTKPVSATVP